MNTVHLLDQHSPDIAGKIWQLARMAYQEEANLIGEDKFPPLNRSIKDIQRSCSHYFGICDGEELLAAIEVEGIEDDLLISSLVVTPSHFRSGLASRLLHAILEHKPRSRFRVETSVRNEPAIKLYKKFGFTEISHRELSGGYKVITMSLGRATPC